MFVKPGGLPPGFFCTNTLNPIYYKQSKNMLNTIYTISFILSFVYLFLLLSAFRNRLSSYYIILYAAILITNFGYMQLSDSDTMRMAVYANQTIHLGSCFMPFLLFMCLADLCKEKIPMWLQTLLITYGGILFFFSSSVGISDLYYKNVSLFQNYGVFMLVKEYGPLHILYPIFLMLTLGGGYFIVIKSFIKKEQISYVNGVLLMLSMTITIAGYILEKKFPNGFPVIPLALDISQTIVFILILRISLYDVGSIVSDLLLETAIGGIICFDKKGRFLGADSDCEEWFPETKSLIIDMPFDPDETDFLKQVGKWIDGEDTKDSVIINRNGHFYKCEHSVKKESNFRFVHCVLIRDDTEQQNYTKLVEKAVNEKTKKLRKIQNDMIIGMAGFVEDRDNNTGGHIQRTSAVINIFVSHLLEEKLYPEVTSTQWHNLIKAAPLHDVGKIGVPDSILNKPGKFTDEEYEIMKTHAARGAVNVDKILRNSEDLEFKKMAVNVAHFHHEKYNGTGYPEKLTGNQIPFEARVMTLADVFDALVSKRVYKDSFSYDKAFSIIEESSGSHFDPDLCIHFLHCRPKLEELYNSFKD